MASYISNITLTFTRQIVSLIIGLAALSLIARTLGPDEQGKYTILILIPLTLFNFLNLGFGASTVYFIGKKNTPISTIYATNKLVAIILSLLALVIGSVFYFIYGNEYLKDISINEFLIIISSLPFIFLNYFFYAIFQGKEDFKSYNTILLLNQLILVLSLVITMVLFKMRLSGAALSFTISHVLTLLIIFYYFNKNNYKLNSSVFSKSYFYTSLKYGLKLFASNVLAFINYRADIFLIAYFLDYKSAGIYAISVAIIERLWIIPGAVSNVLFARISNLTTSAEKNNLTSISTRNLLPLMLIISGLLLVTADIIIPFIFGNEYLDSIPPLYYLFPGIVLGSISKTISNDFSGRGYAEINVYVALFTVTINITGNFILIPQYGIVGAAIATSISYSFNAIAKAIFFSYLYQVSLSDLLLIKKTDLDIYKSITRKYLSKK